MAHQGLQFRPGHCPSGKTTRFSSGSQAEGGEGGEVLSQPACCCLEKLTPVQLAVPFITSFNVDQGPGDLSVVFPRKVYFQVVL